MRVGQVASKPRKPGSPAPRGYMGVTFLGLQKASRYLGHVRTATTNIKIMSRTCTRASSFPVNFRLCPDLRLSRSLSPTLACLHLGTLNASQMPSGFYGWPLLNTHNSKPRGPLRDCEGQLNPYTLNPQALNPIQVKGSLSSPKDSGDDSDAGPQAMTSVTA